MAKLKLATRTPGKGMPFRNAEVEAAVEAGIVRWVVGPEAVAEKAEAAALRSGIFDMENGMYKIRDRVILLSAILQGYDTELVKALQQELYDALLGMVSDIEVLATENKDRFLTVFNSLASAERKAA